jgi:hypothetical protein
MIVPPIIQHISSTLSSNIGTTRFIPLSFKLHNVIHSSTTILVWIGGTAFVLYPHFVRWQLDSKLNKIRKKRRDIQQRYDRIKDASREMEEIVDRMPFPNARFRTDFAELKGEIADLSRLAYEIRMGECDTQEQELMELRARLDGFI